MSTILYIPPAGRADVLAPSVGGGTVPQMYQPWQEDYGDPDGGTWDAAWTLRTADDSGEDPPHGALVLAVGGVPDPIGMGRARDVLAAFEGFTSEAWFDSARNAPIGSWRLVDGMGDNVAFYSPVPVPGAVFLRAVAPELINVGHGERVRALATILAARVGGSVVVLNEETKS